MRRTALTLTAIFLAPLGCGTPVMEDSRNEGPTSHPVASHAGQRDRDALRKQASADVACATDTECVYGSRCDTAVGKCVWDCLASTECGAGHVCNTRGECVPGERVEVPDFRPTVLSGTVRCSVSADCPLNSFCEQSTRTCRQGCTSDAQCSGARCNAYGVCVTSAGAPARAHWVTITPPAFTVQRQRDTANLRARTQPVTIRATSSAPTNAALRLRIAVASRDGRNDGAALVSCDPTGRDAGTQSFATACDLEPQWVAVTGGQVAESTVFVRLRDDFVDSAGSWELRVSGDGVYADAGGTSVFTLPAAVASESGPLEGEYLGTVTLARDGLQTEVPVVAAITPEAVVLYDETRTLSPQGRIYLRRNGGNYREDWVSARSEPAPLQTSVSGGLPVTIVSGGTPQRTAGFVRGTFTFLVGETAVGWRYELSRRGDLAAEACTSARTCGPGRTCNASSSRCDWQTDAPANVATFSGFEHARLARWHRYTSRVVDAIQPLVHSRDNLFQNDFSFQRDTIGIDKLGGLSARQICERDFLSFANARFGTSQRCVNLDYGCVNPGGHCSPRSQDVTTGRALCDQVYKLFNTADRDWIDCSALEPIRTTFVPCTHSNSLYDEFSLPGMPARPGRCRQLHAKTEKTRNISIPYSSYLATCKQSARYFLTPSFNGQERDDVYLCPMDRDVILDNPNPVHAERIACYKPPTRANEVEDARLLDTGRFGNTLAPTSGELRCTNGVVPSPIPIFTMRDTMPANSTGDTGYDLAEKCMRELATDPPSTAEPNVRAHLVNAFQGSNPPACVAWGKLAMTLDYSATRFPRYYQDTLKQWLSAHTYLAQTARTRWNEATVRALGSDPRDSAFRQSAEASPSEFEKSLDVMERGWALLFDRNVVAALNTMPASALADPEFRREYTNASLPGASIQGVGLPAVIYETFADHLRALEMLLDHQGVEDFAWCGSGSNPQRRENLKARVGATIRLSITAEWVADGITARARQHTPALTWQERLGRARSEFGALRQRVITKANDLFECRNPLAREEGDVPLYFGNSADPSFASSDRLYESAKEAVADAAGMLNEARTAWVSARDTRIRQAVDDFDQERRLSDIASRYAGDISTLCGGMANLSPRDVLRRFDGSAPNALQPETCHIDLTRPGCRSASVDSSCYRGENGVAASNIDAAQRALQAALVQYNVALEQHDLQMEKCIDLEDTLRQNQTLRSVHQQKMNELRSVKTSMDVAATAASAIKDCSSIIDQVFSAGVNCGATLTEAGFRMVSLAYGASMDRAQAAHEVTMQMRDDDLRVRQCYFEAQHSYLGLRNLVEEYGKATQALSSSYIALRNGQEKVRQRLNEGKAEFAREQERRAPSVAFHYWYSEKADQFAARLDRAKKFAYRAVQAFEYDYQESLPVKYDVVVARHPEQLTRVLALLAPLRDQKSINGRKPRVGSYVLSLRDDILGLSLRSDGDDEDDAYLINRRLAERIYAPEAAIFNANGVYGGQAVRFSLTPEVLNASQASASLAQCAERSWTIGATVVGDNFGYGGRVPLTILKSNTFSSQWCTGLRPPSASRMQVGRVRPWGDLFDVRSERARVQSDGTSFVPAVLLDTPLNQPVEQLRQPPRPGNDVLQGSTVEFAGRGLYGEYVVVFPPELLSRLRVGSIEDVFLRFDVLSVADAEYR